MIGSYSQTSSMVKNIIIINVAVFLIQQIGVSWMNRPIIEELFSLHYVAVMYDYRVWQVFSYMFLHGGFLHLFMNMLALFFIGIELEREIGPKPFLLYYLATGLGAGLFIFAMDSLKVMMNTGPLSLGYTLGASGAVFGLILLYSILFKERQISILLFFVIPVTIRAKNLLFVSLGLTMLLPFLMGGAKISHVGHIGGVLSGVMFLFLARKNRNFRFCYQSMGEWWKQLFGNLRRRNRPRIIKKYTQGFSSDNDLDETKMSEFEIESKIDNLLDIIAVKGINGLSNEEKSFLERVSYLYRHKFPN